MEAVPDTREVRLRQDGVTWRDLDGEVVALDLRSSTYLTSNASGTLLWHRLQEGATVSRLVALLQESYALTEEAARADVAAFLGALRGRGLLVEQDSP